MALVQRPSPAYAVSGANVIDDFGAVGDGMTNDQPAFANALASIPRGGNIVVPVPPVAYRIDSPLIIGTDQGLIGDATGACRITYTGPGKAIRTSLGALRVHLENLTIDGLNNRNANCGGVYLDGASKSIIRSVVATGFYGTDAQPGSGIWVDAPANGQGYFNSFEHTQSASNSFGFRLTSSTVNSPQGNNFINCDAYANARDGFLIEGANTAGIRIMGGQSAWNGGHGLQIDGMNHTFWGIWIENNRGYGIRNNCGSPYSSVWAAVITGNVLGKWSGVTTGVLILQSP